MKEQGSEQQARPNGRERHQPGEGVTIAAQVFGNYVFVSPAGRPDEATARPALHGAALLVLADQAEEKIELRTGYATHVRRDAVLRPSKNIGDEIMSSHGDTDQESGISVQPNAKEGEATMTTAIACSVCRAGITPGATVCPGCGLQLVAQAVPVIRRRPAPLLPTWSYVLIAIIVLFGVVTAVDKHKAQTDKAEREALLASFHAHGALTTPAAFQTHCGDANEIKTTAAGFELRYHAGDMLVVLPPDGDARFYQQTAVRNASGVFENYNQPVDADFALSRFHCQR